MGEKPLTASGLACWTLRTVLGEGTQASAMTTALSDALQIPGWASAKQYAPQPNKAVLVHVWLDDGLGYRIHAHGSGEGLQGHVGLSIRPRYH